MPRAAHRIADQETFGERPVIVAALSRHREHLRAGTRQQYLFLADMPGKHARRRPVPRGQTPCVRSGPLGLA